MNSRSQYFVVKRLILVAGVEDSMQHGRGVALADFNRDGRTDIVYGNWNGPHRLYLQLNSNRKQRFKVGSFKFVCSNMLIWMMFLLQSDLRVEQVG